SPQWQEDSDSPSPHGAARPSSTTRTGTAPETHRSVPPSSSARGAADQAADLRLDLGSHREDREGGGPEVPVVQEGLRVEAQGCVALVERGPGREEDNDLAVAGVGREAVPGLRVQVRRLLLDDLVQEPSPGRRSPRYARRLHTQPRSATWVRHRFEWRNEW